jgi:hypothetical protein
MELQWALRQEQVLLGQVLLGLRLLGLERLGLGLLLLVQRFRLVLPLQLHMRFRLR